MSATEPHETGRLVLEPLGTPEQLGEVTALVRDPRIARWLSPTCTPPDRAEVPPVLERFAGHRREHGFGFWLLRDPGSRAMVGWGGLNRTSATGEPEVEVGWAIVPERQGEGLASELAVAAVAFAFEGLGLPSVISFTVPENVASRRVMEKTGFTYERDFVHVGRPHALYRRTRC